jgi:hypothetical protein
MYLTEVCAPEAHNSCCEGASGTDRPAQDRVRGERSRPRAGGMGNRRMVKWRRNQRLFNRLRHLHR